MGVPTVQCSAASKASGRRCKNKAIPGGTVCRHHGGAAKRVKAKAAVRAEVMSWGLADIAEDPGEVLLRLVTQSAARCARYAAELEQLVEESPSLREALIAENWSATEKGDLYKTGEYVRGLAQLEAQERDRCANFAAKAVAAGLAERAVRIAERQGALLVEMVQAALREVELTPDQVTSLKAALARQARQLSV